LAKRNRTYKQESGNEERAAANHKLKDQYPSYHHGSDWNYFTSNL